MQSVTPLAEGRCSTSWWPGTVRTRATAERCLPGSRSPAMPSRPFPRGGSAPPVGA